MKIVTLLLFCFCSSKLFSYVTTKTEYGQQLKWESGLDTINILVDPTPKGPYKSSLDTNKIEYILNNSVNEWNQHSPYILKLSYSQSLPNVGQKNTIRFSENAEYFGSGILAITSLSHSASTGRIYTADIIVNNSYLNMNTFTDDPSLSGGHNAYLGDVLTHELGHFLGLGHSEVYGSSMIYSVFKGQHTLHTDDISGIDYLYSQRKSSGIIKGKVVTGDNVSVFGAQVQVISYLTGKVISGVLSDERGEFELKNLSQDDSYLIYILPPRSISSLPIYYKSIQTKFCSGKSFVPSLFNKCGGSSRGRPQIISLKHKTMIDIGNVTIKCDEDLDPNYLYAKGNEESFLIQNSSFSKDLKDAGMVFLGYFTGEEIENELSGKGDHLEIDLSDFTHPGDTQYYLNVKIITEDLGTANGISLDVYNSADILLDKVEMRNGNLGQIETSLELNLALSVTRSENYFKFKVFPKALSIQEKNDLFANSSVMTNQNATYLVMTSIKRLENNSLVDYGLKDSYPYEDNYFCTEGEAINTARPNVLSSNVLGQQQDDALGDAPSCGVIDSNSSSGPQGGLVSFSLGLGLILLLGLRVRKTDDFFV